MSKSRKSVTFSDEVECSAQPTGEFDFDLEEDSLNPALSESDYGNIEGEDDDEALGNRERIAEAESAILDDSFDEMMRQSQRNAPDDSSSDDSSVSGLEGDENINSDLLRGVSESGDHSSLAGEFDASTIDDLPSRRVHVDDFDLPDFDDDDEDLDSLRTSNDGALNTFRRNSSVQEEEQAEILSVNEGDSDAIEAGSDVELEDSCRPRKRRRIRRKASPSNRHCDVSQKKDKLPESTYDSYLSFAQVVISTNDKPFYTPPEAATAEQKEQFKRITKARKIALNACSRGDQHPMEPKKIQESYEKLVELSDEVRSLNKNLREIRMERLKSADSHPINHLMRRQKLMAIPRGLDVYRGNLHSVSPYAIARDFSDLPLAAFYGLPFKPLVCGCTVDVAEAQRLVKKEKSDTLETPEDATVAEILRFHLSEGATPEASSTAGTSENALATVASRLSEVSLAPTVEHQYQEYEPTTVKEEHETGRDEGNTDGHNNDYFAPLNLDCLNELCDF